MFRASEYVVVGKGDRGSSTGRWAGWRQELVQVVAQVCQDSNKEACEVNEIAPHISGLVNGKKEPLEHAT